MMCDNLSLYKSFGSSTTIHPQNQLTTVNSQFFPTYDEDDERRPYMSVKRKLSGLYLFIFDKSVKTGKRFEHISID